MPIAPEPRFKGLNLPRLGLLGLLLLGLALRLPGLTWGLPSPEFSLGTAARGEELAIFGPEPAPAASHIYSYHPDEIFPVKAAAGIVLRGNLNPHFYNYGSLYIYLLAPLLAPLQPHVSLSAAHLLARVLTVIFALATILLTYHIGRRLYGVGVGLLAGGLLAVAPLHVVHSHFATVDVPLTFLTTLCLAFSLSAFRSPRLRFFLLAAAASGLAASVKYSGGCSLLLPLALLLLPDLGLPTSRRLAFALLVGGVFCLAFVSTTPYSLLAPREFLHGVQFEMSHLARGGTSAFLNTPAAPLYHLMNSLPHGLGLILFAACLVGLATALARPQKDERPLIIWTLLSFGAASLSQEKFIRYILPVLPCLILLAARLARVRSKPWRPLAILLLAVSALSACLLSVVHLRYFVLPDARTQAAQWVFERIPAGATIGVPEFPWYYTPPVTPHNGGRVLSGEDFPAWNRTARNPVIFAYSHLGTPLQKQPEFVLFSDIEMKNWLRTPDPQANLFLWLRTPDPHANLFLSRSEYRLVATFGSKPGLGGLPLVGRYPPPDWEYHDPIVWIYERQE